jgi:hypothetical protein
LERVHPTADFFDGVVAISAAGYVQGIVERVLEVVVALSKSFSVRLTGSSIAMFLRLIVAISSYRPWCISPIYAFG